MQWERGPSGTTDAVTNIPRCKDDPLSDPLFSFFCLTSRTFFTLMTDYSSMDAICRMRAMRATWSQVPRVERARARVFKSIFAATVCLLCGCGDFCLSFFFFPSLIGNRRNLCAHYTSGPARRVRYQSIKLYSTWVFTISLTQSLARSSLNEFLILRQNTKNHQRKQTMTRKAM